MYNYLYDTHKCVVKHCKIEQDKAREQDEIYRKQLVELLTLLSKNKITDTEFKKRTKQIQNKIIKNKEKIKFLDCQTKHCNSIVKSKMIYAMKDMMEVKVKDNDYNQKDYTKYLDYLKKNKITTKIIIKAELESQKRIKKMIK